MLKHLQSFNVRAILARVGHGSLPGLQKGPLLHLVSILHAFAKDRGELEVLDLPTLF